MSDHQRDLDLLKRQLMRALEENETLRGENSRLREQKNDVDQDQIGATDQLIDLRSKLYSSGGRL